MKSPAFQFYAADFLVGTMGMSDEEVGVYIKMLALQWVKDGLPKDPKEIKVMVAAKRPPTATVLSKFEVGEDGKIRNPRLESERDKQSSFRASRIAAGAVGGAKRAERIAAAREKATHTKEEWAELRDFFEGCCICGEKSGICKDHITPIYQGGSDGVENLQPLCTRCNASKGPDCTDHREARATQIGKQMPSKWQARASELPKQNVALQSSVFSLQSSDVYRERESKGAPSLKEAISAGLEQGIPDYVTTVWWEARETNGWLKGTQGGGQTPVVNWRTDLSRSRTWAEEEYSKSKKTHSQKTNGYNERTDF